MFWNISGLIGTIVTCLSAIVTFIAFYLSFIHPKYKYWWKRMPLIRRNVTVLIALEERNFREVIVEQLESKLNSDELERKKYRVIGIRTTAEARDVLKKEAVSVLVTYPEKGYYVDGIHLCSDLNLKRNIYTIFITRTPNIKSVYNNLARSISHPFFEVLPMHDNSDFVELISEKARQYHTTKRLLRKLTKRWNKLEEIEDVTVMYVTLGDLGSNIHECRNDRMLRRKHSWYMDRFLSQMTSIVEVYKGIVYPNIDEGVTVIFWPRKERDTLNIAIRTAKEILNKIKVIASEYHLAALINPRIGIATERVTSANLEASGNPIYDVFGIAVSYAKCLALYDKVGENSILIYKPPLNKTRHQHLKEAHGIKEESSGETNLEYVIPFIEFYKI